jgi:hypothetical protein
VREELCDLWERPADIRVITTNGFVKKNGEAVMGRGCAQEAKRRYPGMDLRLGERINRDGNHVHCLIDPMSGIGNTTGLLSFPVKHNWWEPADYDLIVRSAGELVDMVDSRWPFLGDVVVPRPGCGNGQRSWAEVRPLLEPHFDDRFIVVGYPGEDG